MFPSSLPPMVLDLGTGFIWIYSDHLHHRVTAPISIILEDSAALGHAGDATHTGSSAGTAAASDFLCSSGSSAHDLGPV